MTIKFDGANSEALTAPGSTSFDILSEWAIGFVLVVDSPPAGTAQQMILANGSHYYIAYTGSGYGAPNTVVFDTEGTQPAPAHYNIFQGGAWMVVVQRILDAVYWNWCPILDEEPTDGSAVMTYKTLDLYGSLGGVGPFSIGGPTSGQPGQFLNQSIGRVFQINGTLSAFEIAKLAYGHQITSMGKALAYYLRMDDADDIDDLGPNNNVFTPVGTLATGTDPGFGFGAPPTAPVFNTQPAITGTPRVGQAVGYISGEITTNEAPTITQQWTLDGVDIAGATGATYTPVAGDVNKALRVRQIAANSAAPAGVASTSAPATVLVAPSATTRTVAVRLKIDKDTPAANHTGISVSFSTGSGPHNPGTTLFQSGGETADEDGVMEFNFDSGLISAGQQGLLSALGANGLHFLGQVEVA